MDPDEVERLFNDMIMPQDKTRVAGLGEPDVDVERILIPPLANEMLFEGTSDNVTRLELNPSGPGTTPGIQREQKKQFVPDPFKGLTDSLQAIVGGGVEVQRNQRQSRNPFRPTELGSANQLTHNISITKLGEEIDPRFTIGHEFGHVADFRGISPTGETAIGDDREEFADTFARIYQNLQTTKAPTIDEFMRSPDTTPKEHDLIVDMLSTKIFQNHPLAPEARMTQLTRTPPDLAQDATRVQR